MCNNLVWLYDGGLEVVDDCIVPGSIKETVAGVIPIFT